MLINGCLSKNSFEQSTHVHLFSHLNETRSQRIYIHFAFAARNHPYEPNTSSDSEEEILRRLRMQQSHSSHSGQLSKYGSGPLHTNSSALQQVIVPPNESFNDPLGIAERGKVGLPPSSSECSSNSSVEASVESNTGLVNGKKKGMNCRL